MLLVVLSCGVVCVWIFVAILSVLVGVICSLLMFVFDASGDQKAGTDKHSRHNH